MPLHFDKKFILAIQQPPWRLVLFGFCGSSMSDHSVYVDQNFHVCLHSFNHDFISKIHFMFIPLRLTCSISHKTSLQKSVQKKKIFVKMEEVGNSKCLDAGLYTYFVNSYLGYLAGFNLLNQTFLFTDDFCCCIYKQV